MTTSTDDTATLLHTYAQAAAVLGLRKSWLEDAVQRREIPHRRIGRMVRFSDEDLQAIIAAARQPAVRVRQRRG